MANFQDIIDFLRIGRRREEADKGLSISTNVLLTSIEGDENYEVDRQIFETNFASYKRLFQIISDYNATSIYVWESSSIKKFLIQDSNAQYINLLTGIIENPNPSELTDYSIQGDDSSSYFFDVNKNLVVIKSDSVPNISLFPDYIFYDPKSVFFKDIVSGDYDYSFKNPTTTFAEVVKTLFNFNKYRILDSRKKTVTVIKSPKAGEMNLYPFMDFNIGLNRYILKYQYYNKDNPESVFSPSNDDCALILQFRAVGGILSFLNDTIFTQGVNLSSPEDSDNKSSKKTFKNRFKDLVIGPLERNLKNDVQLYYRDALEILFYLPDSIAVELNNDTLWLLIEEGIRRNGLANDLELAEENLYIKILETLLERKGEENNFIERLSQPIDKNGTLILEYLYDRINGENGVRFTSLVNKAWRKTRFVNPDVEKNPEFKSTDGPLLLPYESQKWLGLYFSNAKVNFDSNNEKERILRVAYETGRYKYEMRPGLKTDNLISTPVQIIDYFWYHPFYPVSLKNIEKQDTEIKLDSIVPAFMLKANQHKQFWSNVITSAEYAVDIATTFSGIGNLSKFKYLSKIAARAEGLRFIPPIAQTLATGRAIVTGTAAVIEITSGTINALLKISDLNNTKFGKSLSEFLFWSELLSLSGELTVAIHNGLRKSAKELVEKEEDLAKIEKELDELIINKDSVNKKLSTSEKEETLDILEDFAEISEETRSARKKTRSNPEDQLTAIGRNIPPLTLTEIQKILRWQDHRNSFLKKWRNLDFTHHVQDLESKLDKARNSIKKNLTPDDLAAVIKERRGEQILDINGIAYNHLWENRQALSSIVNATKALRSQMAKNPLNFSEFEELLSDLSKLKDEVNKTIN